MLQQKVDEAYDEVQEFFNDFMNKQVAEIEQLKQSVSVCKSDIVKIQ